MFGLQLSVFKMTTPPPRSHRGWAMLLHGCFPCAACSYPHCCCHLLSVHRERVVAMRCFISGNCLPKKCPILMSLWFLSLVLLQLMLKPFEPMASCPLDLLSIQFCFLIAVTSIRRASELAGVPIPPPYLKFFKECVVLRPSLEFLPKVGSALHLL